jgi:hypothetical protein
MNTIVHAHVVCLAVVNPLPKDKCCILICMLVPCIVVRLLLIVVHIVIFTKMQLNLNEDTGIFIAVNSVVWSIHFCFV